MLQHSFAMKSSDFLHARDPAPGFQYGEGDKSILEVWIS